MRPVARITLRQMQLSTALQRFQRLSLVGRALTGTDQAHPVAMAIVRLTVAAWLCFIIGALLWIGVWWGLLVLVPVCWLSGFALYLLLVVAPARRRS